MLASPVLELHHRHRPFFLYPDMPASEADGADYHLPLVWGERLQAIGSNTQYLEALATQAGLHFNFEALGSSTLDSHRLLLFAEHRDQAAEAKEAKKAKEASCEAKEAKGARIKSTHALDLRMNLAEKYFTKGQRLADHAVLEQAAEEAGLDGQEVRAFLATDQHRAEVLRSARDLGRSGIQSIPVFLFRSGDWTARVHGSSDVQTFLDVFKRADAHWQQQQ